MYALLLEACARRQTCFCSLRKAKYKLYVQLAFVYLCSVTRSCLPFELRHTEARVFQSVFFTPFPLPPPPIVTCVIVFLKLHFVISFYLRFYCVDNIKHEDTLIFPRKTE